MITAHLSLISGVVIFERGKQEYRGLIPIATGPAKAVRELMETTCRHAYDVADSNVASQRKELLVPGVPEAESDKDALVAINKFRDWIRRHKAPGVTVYD